MNITLDCFSRKDAGMARETDIAIIGAGPYGLSIAAHLGAKGADFLIFGTPMGEWRHNMPPGMFLKSEGFASDLFDPEGELTLERYCRAHGHPYGHIGVPVTRDLFCEYGLAFQRRFAPDLIPAQVSHVQMADGGFLLRLATGETVRAHRVILAVGISHYAHLPPELAALPTDVVRHSSQQRDLSSYANQAVAVIGAGSSAIDMAALLHQAGARTRLLTRRSKIWFNQPPVAQGGLKRVTSRITRPRSGLGLGWRSRMACDMPTVFHHMPPRFRFRVTRGHLGPSASWMARSMVEGKVEISLQMKLRNAILRDGRPVLSFETADGATEEVVVDQVIAGTGYKVDVDKLTFLDPAIRSRIMRERTTPVLSRNFESSVAGLYFVGVSAANSFGPLLRFAWGARFTARRLAAHLIRTGVGSTRPMTGDLRPISAGNDGITADAA